MPRAMLRDRQASFRGGLNTSADESQLRPDEVRLAENARLTEYGGITKRLGTQKTTLLSLLSAIQGGFTWRRTNPATHLVVVNGHLRTTAHGLYPWTYADLGAGLDPIVRPQFASFRDTADDVVYIADGGLLNKFGPAGFQTNLSGTPSVSGVAVQNLRLFGYGDPANPEMLYFSGLSNGDTLGNVASGGGSAIIRTFANERLVTAVAVGQSLLLIHERGISRFTGWSQDDFNVDAGTRGVTQDIGTIAAGSVVAVENVAFLCSDRGIYAVTESGVTAISQKIESLLAAVSITDLQKVSAVHQRLFHEVWFSVPNLGVLIYNYRLQAWSGPYTGAYLTNSPIAMWESGAGAVPQIFFGGSDGWVRQADVPDVFFDSVGADGVSGDAILMNVQCHRMFFGDPATEKSLRFIYATSRLRGSDGAALFWETGEQTGAAGLFELGAGSFWGAFTWGAFTWGAGGSATERVHADGRGKYVDVRIADGGTSNPVFSLIEADAFDMGRRY